ncbi:MAG: hypothetical protein WDZ73_01335 [Candidatus Paceibacterota bacterium]
MQPKIRIKYGKLLDPFLKVYVESKYNGYKFPSEEEVKRKVKLFRGIWEKYDYKFFNGLDKLGLSFKRNLIEVFIVSAVNRDMSSPLIIRSRYNEEEFINVLIHELLHVLLADNEIKPTFKFGDETMSTQNHVYVFALMTYLFKDIFKEEYRLITERQKSSAFKNEDYFKAWNIVKTIGYQSIVDEIKKVPKT